jgi:hypothetical protein
MACVLMLGGSVTVQLVKWVAVCMTHTNHFHLVCLQGLPAAEQLPGIADIHSTVQAA